MPYLEKQFSVIAVEIRAWDVNYIPPEIMYMITYVLFDLFGKMAEAIHGAIRIYSAFHSIWYNVYCCLRIIILEPVTNDVSTWNYKAYGTSHPKQTNGNYIDYFDHIGAETIWPIFCRRYFLNEYMNFALDFTEVPSLGSN